MITEPGIYEMSDADYQADPCEEISLRSSYVAKLLEKGSTPAHVAYQIPRINPDYKREEKRHFDIGKAAHTLLLGRGAAYAIVHADSYRTKAAQEERDLIYLSHKTPLLETEAVQVRAMVKAARRQIDELIEAESVPCDPFDSAYTEKVIVWRDPITNVLCRAMLDGLPIMEDFVGEYKTDGQSAALENFQWKARKMGYIARLAFYRRGLEALKIAFSPTIGMFVQETFEPYLLAYHRITDELIERADREVTAAMKLWRKCLETGKWPGYSAEGYVLDLTERERQAEYGESNQNPIITHHVMSEDLPDDVYSKVTFK